LVATMNAPSAAAPWRSSSAPATASFGHISSSVACSFCLVLSLRSGVWSELGPGGVVRYLLGSSLRCLWSSLPPLRENTEEPMCFLSVSLPLREAWGVSATHSPTADRLRGARLVGTGSFCGKSAVGCSRLRLLQPTCEDREPDDQNRPVAATPASTPRSTTPGRRTFSLQTSDRTPRPARRAVLRQELERQA
jgi:hypothetical protein